jgi:hypothetical protein
MVCILYNWDVFIQRLYLRLKVLMLRFIMLKQLLLRILVSFKMWNFTAELFIFLLQLNNFFLLLADKLLLGGPDNFKGSCFSKILNVLK